ncbi:MAG: DUF5320 domain-containing protein [Planctomycetota bacterium]|nr:DUF5320 domain-containing protein [Planctomycetota bacterium]
MPGGDRTGPMGMGPMTGRAAGYCVGSPTPGFANAPGGRGLGGGRGFGGGRGGRGGRGWRNQFYATGLTGWQREAADMSAVASNQPTEVPQTEQNVSASVSKEQEIEQLKSQAAEMANMLGEITKRIDGLESQEV